MGFKGGSLMSNCIFLHPVEVTDATANDFKAFCETLGLPYVEPELSPEGMHLLEHEFTQFLKDYLSAAKNLEHNGLNFICI